MKTIRTLMALPFILLGLIGFCATIYNFGAALVTWSWTPFWLAFLIMGVSVVLLAIGTVLNPKPAKKTENREPLTNTKIITQIIPADSSRPVRLSRRDATLKSHQEAVGGDIEPVGRGLDWVAYADEEGKLKGKPYNTRATHAMGFMSGHNLNDPIAGDVLITGTDKHGGPADLSAEVSGRVEQITGEVTA